MTATGFTKAELHGRRVTLNKITTANVKLDVGTNVETVEVTAAAPPSTPPRRASDFVRNGELADLPSASGGSGVINLSLLDAGVGTSGAVGLGAGPSVGGQRPRNNNFTVEGIDNNSGSVTGPLVTVPNDAVAEFTLQQNQFSPDFGHSSGGQFNQVVKSGTNQFHGAAYEYLHNRNLNAADNLIGRNGNPAAPALRRQPLRRRRSAARSRRTRCSSYGLYEYNPIGQAPPLARCLRPTSTGWATISRYPGHQPEQHEPLKKYLGTAPAAVSASSLRRAIPWWAGQREPGMDSAQTRRRKSDRDRPDQLQCAALHQQRIRRRLVRLQHLRQGQPARAFHPEPRRHHRHRGFPLPFSSRLYPPTPTWRRSPSSTRSRPVGQRIPAWGTTATPSDHPVGTQKWPGLDVFPNHRGLRTELTIWARIRNAPQSGIQNQYQLTDNVTWTKGTHTLKFGFDGWKQISPQTFTQRARGDYEWNYLSDYLFDYNPDVIAQRSLGNSKYYGDRILTGFYANDSWKAKAEPYLEPGPALRIPDGPLQRDVADASTRSPTFRG